MNCQKSYREVEVTGERTKQSMENKGVSFADEDAAGSDTMDPEEVEAKRKRFAQEAQRRRSMAYEQGREGKHVAKGIHTGKAIAVFTSGGDAQGMLGWVNFTLPVRDPPYLIIAGNCQGN